MKKYVVTGYYYRDNKTFSKEFRTLNKANRYLDSKIEECGVFVEDARIEGNKTSYICNDNAQFVIETL